MAGSTTVTVDGEPILPGLPLLQILPGRRPDFGVVPLLSPDSGRT
jgi:hypothetical protein